MCILLDIWGRLGVPISPFEGSRASEEGLIFCAFPLFAYCIVYLLLKVILFLHDELLLG